MLFADDTVLIADSHERLRQLVKKFWRVCERGLIYTEVMKCTRIVDDTMMNVALNGKLFEVKPFEYLAFHIAAEG